MWSLICNASEYVEERWRCFGDALEMHQRRCRVQYAGSYSDIYPGSAIYNGWVMWRKELSRGKAVTHYCQMKEDQTNTQKVYSQYLLA